MCAFFFASPFWSWAAPLPESVVSVEVRYEVPAAGEVDFFWGINGWHPVDEQIRPQGTKIINAIMSSPMTRMDGVFTATIHTESGNLVDYGFLIKKTASGAPVEMWDGDNSYHFTVKESGIVHLRSKRLYPFAHVLTDRAGIAFMTILGIGFATMAVAYALFLLRHRKGLRYEFTRHSPDPRFAITLSLLTAILGLTVILNHEMWRDELQAWRIVTSSDTIGDLLNNSRYEGHPALWYLSLYLVSRLSASPTAMQLLHLLIGTSATFILCKYSPFNRWQKTALCFGYFMFFEYFIVSRNYALGVLALWSFCALRVQNPGRIFASAATLGILANTSAFGTILAVSLGVWLLIETSSKGQETSILQRVGIVSTLAVGVFLAGIQSAPPDDNSPRMLTWNTALLGAPLEKTFGSVWKSYVPLPGDIPHFWNTNLLDGLPPINVGTQTLESRDVQVLLSLSLIAISAFVLMRTPTVMLAYIVTTLALLFFLHTKVNHGVRHTGHLFLLLIACLWLSHQTSVLSSSFSNRKLASIYTAILFTIQPVAGALCASTDLVYPFSAGKAAAEYIRERQLIGTMMVGSNYAIVSTVAGYLNYPIYYVENGQTGIYTLWGKKRSGFPPAEVIDKATRLHHAANRDVLLILSYDPGASAAGLLKLASFEHSVLREERYWLFLLPKKSEEQRVLEKASP
jgi:hypothetical protein